MSRIFLVDTNVLWNLPLCTRLTEKIATGTVRVYIPALVHAERLRQIADRYGERFSIDVVRQFLGASRFEVLPLSDRDAEAVADFWLILKSQGYTQSSWRTHRFDILLCAVARSRGYTLVTDDTEDHFLVLEDRINTTDLETWLDTSNST
jgi:predicted nucleic acid-binding protein